MMSDEMILDKILILTNNKGSHLARTRKQTWWATYQVNLLEVQSQLWPYRWGW